MFSEYYLTIAIVICVIAMISTAFANDEDAFKATGFLCIAYLIYVFLWTESKGLSLILGGIFLLLISFANFFAKLDKRTLTDQETCPDCNGRGMRSIADYDANIPGCYMDIPCTRCGGHIIPSKHIAAGYYSEAKNIPGREAISKLKRYMTLKEMLSQLMRFKVLRTLFS